MATLEEALERVEIGSSISQTIWTQHPESAGITPEDGREYQIKMVITKTAKDAHSLEARVIGSRPIVS